MTLCDGVTHDNVGTHLMTETTTPDAEQLKTHIREFASALNEGDLTVVEESFADDYVGHVPPQPGKIRGPKGYRAFVGGFRTAFPDFEMSIQDLIVEGETVVCRFTMGGTHEGEFMGVEPTGKKVMGDAMTFIRFEGGKRTEERGLFDALGVMQQLGVVDSPADVTEETDEATTIQTPPLSADAIHDLTERFHGEVVLPEDDGYDDARAVWNGMIDKHPRLIARCHGVADVVDAVNFAREHDLLVAVRGGGHNVAGTAVCDDGIVIDLSEMRGVHVDPDAQTVRAEAGATWADLDRETQLFGLATPGGLISTTGIAGLTLGGGIGWLRRKYGLSIDTLVSVDLVTVDGDVITASEDEHAELFWGLRGGGGNFGVVTSFEYQLHPVGPEVAFAGTLYPLETAHTVVSEWRDFMDDAPEEVSSSAIFWSVPAVPDFPEEIHGEPIVAVTALHCGSVEDGQRVLAPLRELADPLIDLSGVYPYTAVQQMYDAFFPEGELCYYWKSLELDKLDDEAIEAVAGAAEDRPSPLTPMVIWHHGGAMSRVDASETAYGDRSTTYLLSIDSTWEDPDDTEENIEWTRELWADMHRFSDGGLYLNFPGFGEEGEELVRSATGQENYDRLVELKSEYDPTNLFRLNQNVKPTT